MATLRPLRKRTHRDLSTLCSKHAMSDHPKRTVRLKLTITKSSPSSTRNRHMRRVSSIKPKQIVMLTSRIQPGARAETATTRKRALNPAVTAQYSSWYSLGRSSSRSADGLTRPTLGPDVLPGRQLLSQLDTTAPGSSRPTSPGSTSSAASGAGPPRCLSSPEPTRLADERLEAEQDIGWSLSDLDAALDHLGGVSDPLAMLELEILRDRSGDVTSCRGIAAGAPAPRRTVTRGCELGPPFTDALSDSPLADALSVRRERRTAPGRGPCLVAALAAPAWPWSLSARGPKMQMLL
jgi:hypothetical protein